MPFPKAILVMRHAEKPDDVRDPDLSPAGFERADRLAQYIPSEFGPIDFIFAAAISKHSARPYETVRPLAKATGVRIDASIADQDYPVLADDLVNDAQYDGKGVVVCWHHEHIPGLMNALGAPDGSYPSPWDDKVFNLVLKTVRAADGSVTVQQIVEPF